MLLTESRNQVEAILSRGALDQYQRVSQGQDPTQIKPQGFFINLLDFEVVLVYSTKPTIHLYVKDFLIEWENNTGRAALGKTLINDRGVSHKLRKAFQKATEVQQTRNLTDLAGGNESDTSVRSQENTNSSRPAPGNVLGAGVSQEAFVSQVPADHHYGSLDIAPAIERGPLTYANELLGLLGRPEGARSERAGNTNNLDQQGVDPQTSQHVAKHDKNQSRSDPRDSPEVNGSSVLNGSQTRVLTAVSEPMRPSTTVGTQTGGSKTGADIDPSTTKTVDEDVNGTDIGPEGVKASRNSNSKGTVVEGTEEQITERPETPIGDNPPNSGNPDPWNGLSRIRARDVRIPSDQMSLLENKRCWVPPSPGTDLPRGHVPPPLLEQWNKTALRRNRSPDGEKLSHAVSGASHACKGSPSRASSTSETDSEGSQLSWASSPSQRDPRKELPADSSPIRTKAAPKGELSRDVDSRIVGNVGNPWLKDGDAGEPDISRDPSHQNQKLMDITVSIPGNGNSPEHSDDDDDDDYDGNSDSPMDTSVPFPLGGTQQSQVTTSQSEQEFTSSGPSLPGLSTQEQVQVLETPSGYFNRRRSEGAASKGDTRKDEREEHDSQQRSSQVAKSSSQSWILNTYQCNEGTAKEPRSQEISNPSLGETGPSVDVMGTQINNESWSGQQATPHSPSDLVLDSSEVRQHGRSPTMSAAQAAISQQLSSNSDALLSQSDVGSHGLGTYSSSRETRSQGGRGSSRGPNLKRPAAEIDGGESLPKRHKSVLQEIGQVTEANGRESSKSDAATRRQSYIGGSSKLADALRAHEKFQNDYPSYSGDFAHFTSLCHKLHCLRTEGKLTRSFLWDDFMIMNLQKYPKYLENCHAMNSKTLGYEDYFSSNFSRPSHRRRSLTASVIELVAAQYVSVDQSPPGPTAAHDDEANTSFTHSLANKLTHLRAHSIGTPATSGQSDAGVDRIQTTSSSGHSRNLDTSVNEREPSVAEKQSSGADKDLATSSFDASQQEIQEISESSFGESESDEEDEDADTQMEEAHETASIELFDENDASVSSQKVPVEAEVSSGPESINENWFTSLRHIRPTGPVWSDDRNTPFKAWARADLNVLSERRLRGGRYLAVDKSGVIQRTTRHHDHD